MFGLSGREQEARVRPGAAMALLAPLRSNEIGMTPRQSFRKRGSDGGGEARAVRRLARSYATF